MSLRNPEVFARGSMEYAILNTATIMADALDLEASYAVGECWMDYGAGLAWTTILRAKMGDGQSYQWLSPKEWSDLINGGLKGVYNFISKKVVETKNRGW